MNVVHLRTTEEIRHNTVVLSLAREVAMSDISLGTSIRDTNRARTSLVL